MHHTTQRHPASISARVARTIINESTEAAAGDGGAAAQPQPSGAGGGVAPPSNTATHGYDNGKGNEDKGFKLLRVGVDSLYLSYHGDLSHAVDSELAQLKFHAQSRYPEERATAQKVIRGHILEVLDRGQGGFAYILQDGSYRICLRSGQSGRLPMAYVKVSAELLAHKLPEQVVEELTAIVEELGECGNIPMVSRIDLFADFVTGTDLQAIPDRAWVTQASSITRHTEQMKLTGWSFGLGAALSARLYDKTREIEKSKKYFLLDLWERSGWDGQAQVWRLEFQFTREVLALFRLSTFPQVRDKLGSLWQTVTGSWLRLTIPDESDTNRSRWPTHPTWEQLNNIRWRLDDAPLTRQYSPARVPSDDYLGRSCVALTTNYMAKHHIADFDAGAAALVSTGKSIVKGRCEDKLNISFPDWIAQQLAIKSRQFNSRRNTAPPSEEATTSEEVDRDSIDYDDASNGA